MRESTAAAQRQTERQWLVFPKVDMDERDHGPRIGLYGAPDPVREEANMLEQDGIESGGECEDDIMRETRYSRWGLYW